MLAPNQIARFINQPYLRKKLINHLDFWYGVRDSKYLTDGL